MFLKYYKLVQVEVVRKGQHIAFSFSIFIVPHRFSMWYAAVSARSCGPEA